MQQNEEVKYYTQWLFMCFACIIGALRFVHIIIYINLLSIRLLVFLVHVNCHSTHKQLRSFRNEAIWFIRLSHFSIPFRFLLFA